MKHSETYAYLEYDDKAFRHKRVSSNEGSDRVNEPLEEFDEDEAGWFGVDMDALTYVANIRMFGSRLTPEQVRALTESQSAA